MDRFCYYYCCCGRCTCNLTEDERVALDCNQKIEKDLREQKRKDKKEMKILLLGTGESGKSTFIKQMRIIHGGGYSDEDRKVFAKLVYQNIFTSIQSIIGAMEILRIPYAVNENKLHGRFVQDVDVYSVVSLERQYTEAIKKLWQDPGIKACYQRRREYHLLDSASYYLSRLDRITEDGYVPSPEDILRIRMPTTGINEYLFSVDAINLRIVDVGGQKSERRKWIHSFQNVGFMIFLASLSEYDQRLEETNQENRMQESLALFSNVLRMPYFTQTAIILFLNKTDILAEKIAGSDLSDYFPEFSGPKKDPEKAQKFILGKYEAIYHKCSMKENGKKVDKDRTFHTHFTCATETANIRKVFDDVKQAVLFKHLKAFSLV